MTALHESRALTRLLLALGALLFVLPGVADARRYSVEIDVNDSDELRELYYEGIIDEDEFDILIRLIENPIDLNQAEKFDVFQLPDIDAGLADRIVEERILNGPYTLLADLVNRVPGIDWRMVDRIRPFTYLRLPEGTAPALRGEMGFIVFKRFRAASEGDYNGNVVIEPIEDNTPDYPAKSHTPGELGYDKWPNFGLGVHMDVQGWLDLGLTGVAQEGLWNVEYDPHSQDIYGSFGTPVFRPYAGYVRLRRPLGRSSVEAVVGSYQLNFGEGLVMNTLGGRKRFGFKVPGKVSIERDSTRFREWDGLFGGASNLRAPLSGGAELDLTVFGSLRNHDAFVSHIKSAGGVVYDPTVDNGLETPRVWVEGQKLSNQRLPNVYRVGLIGGNATFRINRRTHLGITGYAGLTDRTIMKGVDDQNQLLLKRRFPVRRSFGTVGVNGRIGFGLLEVSGEYALALGDDVGQGMIVFVELEPAWGRFIFTARHYDIKFGSPYAKAQASPSIIAGLRTRGEQGLRFRAVVDPMKRFSARVTFDLNRLLTLGIWDFWTKGSVQGRPLEFLQLQLLTSYKNQNLAVNGREQRYGGTITEQDILDFEFDDDGEELSLYHSGEKITVSGGARVDHKKYGSVNVRYSRTWTDYGKTFPVRNSDQCRVDWLQGHALRVWGRVKPSKTTTISGTFTVRDTDVSGNKSGSSYPARSGKHGFEGGLTVSQKIADRVTLRLSGYVGKRFRDVPSECDFGDDDLQIGAPEWEYEPTPYDLRWSGEFLFQMKVKFN